MAFSAAARRPPPRSTETATTTTTISSVPLSQTALPQKLVLLLHASCVLIRTPRPPSYREERPRDYNSIFGSKRPYSAVGDVSPCYIDTGVRPSRNRLHYGVGGSSSQYADFLSLLVRDCGFNA